VRRRDVANRVSQARAGAWGRDDDAPLDRAFDRVDHSEHEPAMRSWPTFVVLPLGHELNVDRRARCSMGELGLPRRRNLDPLRIPVALVTTLKLSRWNYCMRGSTLVSMTGLLLLEGSLGGAPASPNPQRQKFWKNNELRNRVVLIVKKGRSSRS
jgi:hypothetical protein